MSFFWSHHQPEKDKSYVYTPTGVEPYVEPNIFIGETKLEVVDKFVYLGSTLSRDGSLDEETAFRINKATKSFGALENRYWSDRNININTKLHVYQSCVLLCLFFILPRLGQFIVNV